MMISPHIAPALQVEQWFNSPLPITLESLRGKIVVMEAFQMLCPGCVSHGLPQAMRVVQALRGAGIRVQMHGAATAEGMGSMKSQFKKADSSGAHCALIFGGDEMQRGMITVKQLRDGAGAQAEYAIESVADWTPLLRA